MKKRVNQKSENIIQTFHIDAKDKILGRLASGVALILRGKNLAKFRPNQLINNKVIIDNISGLKVSGKKMKQKKYHRFTGYPGGIRTQSLGELWLKNPGILFKNVVYNMLPENKLRKKIMKNLIIKK